MFPQQFPLALWGTLSCPCKPWWLEHLTSSITIEKIPITCDQIHARSNLFLPNLWQLLYQCPYWHQSRLPFFHKAFLRQRKCYRNYSAYNGRKFRNWNGYDGPCLLTMSLAILTWLWPLFHTRSQRHSVHKICFLAVLPLCLRPKTFTPSGSWKRFLKFSLFYYGASWVKQ